MLSASIQHTEFKVQRVTIMWLHEIGSLSAASVLEYFASKWSYLLEFFFFLRWKSYLICHAHSALNFLIFF